MGNFVFFHNPDEENGYLSNWYLSDFEYDVVGYSSMEQFMMHQKALLFNDYDIAGKILETNNIVDIKVLGRHVHGFSDTVWDRNKCRIVCDGLYQKFKCNSDLGEKLVGTGHAVLAECAVKDKVWGIGLGMHDNARFNRGRWKGLNLLGECLMRTRRKLQAEKEGR